MKLSSNSVRSAVAAGLVTIGAGSFALLSAEQICDDSHKAVCHACCDRLQMTYDACFVGNSNQVYCKCMVNGNSFDCS
jgi:hypothetical protein